MTSTSSAPVPRRTGSTAMLAGDKPLDHAITAADPVRFSRLAELADERIIIPLEESSPPRLCLGPCLPTTAFEETVVPLDYLRSSVDIPIARPHFPIPINWENREEYICFPSSDGPVKEWLRLWGQKLKSKLELLGMWDLFVISRRVKHCNPRTCASLLSFWDSSVNCFFLPSGPISITLEDVSVLTNCYITGTLPRLHEEKGDFKCQQHRIRDTIKRHMSLYDSGGLEAWKEQEEFDFFLE